MFATDCLVIQNLSGWIWSMHVVKKPFLFAVWICWNAVCYYETCHTSRAG